MLTWLHIARLLCIPGVCREDACVVPLLYNDEGQFGQRTDAKLQHIKIGCQRQDLKASPLRVPGSQGQYDVSMLTRNSCYVDLLTRSAMQLEFPRCLLLFPCLLDHDPQNKCKSVCSCQREQERTGHIQRRQHASKPLSWNGGIQILPLVR